MQDHQVPAEKFDERAIKRLIPGHGSAALRGRVRRSPLSPGARDVPGEDDGRKQNILAGEHRRVVAEANLSLVLAGGIPSNLITGAESRRVVAEADGALVLSLGIAENFTASAECRGVIAEADAALVLGLGIADHLIASAECGRVIAEANVPRSRVAISLLTLSPAWIERRIALLIVSLLDGNFCRVATGKAWSGKTLSETIELKYGPPPDLCIKTKVLSGPEPKSRLAILRTDLFQMAV